MGIFTLRAGVFFPQNFVPQIGFHWKRSPCIWSGKKEEKAKETFCFALQKMGRREYHKISKWAVDRGASRKAARGD